MRSGGCQCGNVRYKVSNEPVYSALCHCADCRASSGAPAVAWMAFKQEYLDVESGDLSTYEGKNGSFRQFCPNCGTGLFFRNENTLPGLVDIQSSTLDNPEDNPPALQIQCAERLPWMKELGTLPEVDRYPGAA